MKTQQLSEPPAHPEAAGGRDFAHLGQHKDKRPPLLCRGGGARAPRGTRDRVRQVTEAHRGGWETAVALPKLLTCLVLIPAPPVTLELANARRGGSGGAFPPGVCGSGRVSTGGLWQRGAGERHCAWRLTAVIRKGEGKELRGDTASSWSCFGGLGPH